MKEGWTYKKIKEVCTSVTDGDWIEKKDQSQSGIRLIQTGNIGVGEFIPKDDSHRYISEDTFNRLKCTEIFEGDILISRLPNPLGRSCILPKLDTKCITAVDCSILRTKSDELLPKFFVYYTQSQGYFSKINAESSGTTRARITRKKLEETTIPTPSISVQQRIVERLDSAFENIDKLKANAEKQLAEARILFQKSLAKAMEPKEGWEEKLFGDICTLSQGLAINSHTKHLLNQKGSLPLLRIKDMKEGTREIFVDEENCPQGCIANEEDIIYTRTGTLGLVFTGMHGVLHNNCFKIKHDNNKLNKAFLIYFLRNDSFMKKIIRLASRAAQPDITHKLFKAQEIQFPPLPVQQRIVERLDSLSENVRKYEEIQRQIISECDALKQALLRKVFE